MTSPTDPATGAAAPPVTLLLDTHDDRTIHAAAYQRARPDRGRITTDPTPHTSSLAYLALDLLRAMGRDSLSAGRRASRHGPRLVQAVLVPIRNAVFMNSLAVSGNLQLGRPGGSCLSEGGRWGGSALAGRL
ncbi:MULTISPECIES: hypothetical protein [unclassified Streptomyces]|uniref:hypothetical protein n=1 Tax=unclassified Streptomyces TaxID=2593676 RepID=UPI002DD9A6D8|nr:hypothetical protein [Streptomyces sp. NBC_01750]WSA97905.1 hypothetical protein OIE54_00615 [Streptomyces sp. NBC_01794]WSD30592.1 hypothetical protein OG966_00490 [Streptomyces sp. NBC_01750]